MVAPDRLAGRAGRGKGAAVKPALRQVAAPFVAAPPIGVRVRARLRVSSQDEAVLWVVGTYLGSLAGQDLAARCGEGQLDAKGRAASRAIRRSLTAASSSRWAGAISDLLDCARQHSAPAQHWLAPLRERHPKATGHHAAALVIGRRGLGHGARRRVTGNQTAPAEAARSTQMRPRTTPAAENAPRNPATPRGPRQPPGTKTRRSHRTTAGNQAAYDRSRPPATQDYVLLAQQER